MKNELMIEAKDKSLAAEAFRTLRTNLQFTFIDNDIKVLMVTSSLPGEGKSFVSSNLSSVFAMQNKKVLLIDCDLRKGRVHDIFNLDNENGLSDLLLNDLKEYKKYIKKTEIDNLSAITRGTISQNPSELLSSEKNKKLMDKLRKDFDLIILDCPPINAVADALVLTSIIDEAVLVAAYKFTPMDALVTAYKAIEASGTKIAGVIFNKVEKGGSKYYYYDKYYE